jgi:fructosamine-3-kinase
MTLPPAIAEFVEIQGWGAVRGSSPLGGGCINHTLRLETQHGPRVLVKFNLLAPSDLFHCEAEGLAALRTAPGGPRVPNVLGVGEGWIVLEYVESAAPRKEFSALLAGQLASLHQRTATSFGFESDNYLGSTPQRNPPTADGFQFFADSRLRPLARLAADRRLIGNDDVHSIESVCHRLPELVPAQPASLLHGDLWAGNLMSGPQGEPVLIDPATHYGWAEAELGMMHLFGGFEPQVFEEYAARRNLQPGWRERLDLYNLYHLLNHVLLFGAGYLAQFRHTLSRYR